MRDFDKQMEMVLYHSDEGDVSVDAYIKDESIWITQKAMAELFGVNVPDISKHLSNIYDEGELEKETTVSKMEIVQREGNRDVKRTPVFYNLDAIISVGYRVNSIKATNKQAIDKANAEYEIFNRTQPIESDFDKAVKKMLKESN